MQQQSWIDKVIEWASFTAVTQPPDDFYCQTRDVFQARLDTLRILLDKEDKFGDATSLIIAVVGEIGNNAFDHNIGNWRDVAGVYFQYDMKEGAIVCADRGQGIRATLQKVLPEIQTDAEALHIAFTERISGRAPENRGNGLKFVRTVVEQQKWHLVMRSGNAEAVVGKEFTIRESIPSIHGCVVVINF